MYFDKDNLINQEFKKRTKNKKFIYAYKILCISKEKVLFSVYYTWSWYVGETTSDRWTTALTGTEERQQIINYGIHVYLRKKDAHNTINNCLGEEKEYVRVVRFKCFIKDLVATDKYRYFQAVFHKVTLSKTEYEKAIK